MIVSSSGASIEYDCASGKIDGPIVLDANGGFSARGSYVPEHGGPRRGDDASASRARYTGRVRGASMRLTVSLEQSKTPLGAFTLRRGNDPLLTKCR